MVHFHKFLPETHPKNKKIEKKTLFTVKVGNDYSFNTTSPAASNRHHLSSPNYERPQGSVQLCVLGDHPEIPSSVAQEMLQEITCSASPLSPTGPPLLRSVPPPAGATGRESAGLLGPRPRLWGLSGPSCLSGLQRPQLRMRSLIGTSRFQTQIFFSLQNLGQNSHRGKGKETKPLWPSRRRRGQACPPGFPLPPADWAPGKQTPRGAWKVTLSCDFWHQVRRLIILLGARQLNIGLYSILWERNIKSGGRGSGGGGEGRKDEAN